MKIINMCIRYFFKIIGIILLVSILLVIIGGDEIFASYAETTPNYTEEDLNNKYNEGYLDGIGDLEYFESKILELYELLEKNEEKANLKYNQMTQYYEEEIKNLNQKIEILNEYIKIILEQYTIDLGFEFESNLGQLAILNLQLSSYRALEASYEIKMNNASTSLSSLQDIEPLVLERDNLFVQKDILLKEMDDYVWNIGKIEYIDNINRYFNKKVICDFGDEIDHDEYLIAINSLSFYYSPEITEEENFVLPNGEKIRKSYPTDNLGAENYWGSSYVAFGIYATRRARFGFPITADLASPTSCSYKMNSLILSYVYYYEDVIFSYDNHAVAYNNIEANYININNQHIQISNLIDTIIEDRAIYQYIYEDCVAKLTEIKSKINDLTSKISILEESQYED